MGRSKSNNPKITSKIDQYCEKFVGASTKLATATTFAAAATAAAVTLASLSLVIAEPAYAATTEGGGGGGGGGATTAANAKITTGGASTLQSGRTIAITRGVNLDRSDFSNQNLK